MNNKKCHILHKTWMIACRHAKSKTGGKVHTFHGNFGYFFFLLHPFLYLLAILKQYDSQSLGSQKYGTSPLNTFSSKTLNTPFTKQITFHIDIWAKKAFWCTISCYFTGFRWTNIIPVRKDFSGPCQLGMTHRIYTTDIFILHLE